MIIFAAGVGATLMLLAGCALFIYMLMRKAHLRQEAERRSRIIMDVHPLPASRAPGKNHENARNMTERADDLDRQLTTKIIVLELLIADSQKQIERMEELLQRMEAAKRE